MQRLGSLDDDEAGLAARRPVGRPPVRDRAQTRGGRGRPGRRCWRSSCSRRTASSGRSSSSPRRPGMPAGCRAIRAGSTTRSERTSASRSSTREDFADPHVAWQAEFWNRSVHRLFGVTAQDPSIPDVSTSLDRTGQDHPGLPASSPDRRPRYVLATPTSDVDGTRFGVGRTARSLACALAAAAAEPAPEASRPTAGRAPRPRTRATSSRRARLTSTSRIAPGLLARAHRARAGRRRPVPHRDGAPKITGSGRARRARPGRRDGAAPPADPERAVPGPPHRDARPSRPRSSGPSPDTRQLGARARFVVR